jgi:putative phosphoribosyl transferase
MSTTRIPLPAEDTELEAILEVPPGARGVVVFAHGTGSSRLSPRNASVAQYLRSTGEFGTLLFDLLTVEEDRVYENRFDIDLLTRRLAHAVDWVRSLQECRQCDIGLFGASTGAAAALRVAADLPQVIRAVVSRGGRPDLAGDGLAHVRAPVLLIVGGADELVITLNERARRLLAGHSELVVVPGATHLFEEPGALEQVAKLTLEFLRREM